jgi:hypothetical protein
MSRFSSAHYCQGTAYYVSVLLHGEHYGKRVSYLDHHKELTSSRRAGSDYVGSPIYDPSIYNPFLHKNTLR